MTAFFSVTCPHCGRPTQVGFQQGYTTNAAPQCSKCGRQFLVIRGLEAIASLLFMRLKGKQLLVICLNV